MALRSSPYIASGKKGLVRQPKTALSLTFDDDGGAFMAPLFFVSRERTPTSMRRAWLHEE